MNILEKIVLEKRSEVQHLSPRPCSADHLRWAVKAYGARRNFLDEVRFPRKSSIALIAEVKKASPSAGVIRPNFHPVQIAREYEAAGAACLSVLTDEKFFQGSLSYLEEIRKAVSLPLLRKDFIIEERQILETVEAGADAILLIAAILQQDQLTKLLQLSQDAGLTALVEVHTPGEMERALAAGAYLIGVNNRDLTTFTTDLAVSEKLAAVVEDMAAEAKITLVAESGIHSRADVLRLKKAGFQAILVGESLMRAESISAKAGELLGSF